MIIPRRTFIKGMASLLAAPAIVKAGSLMPVRSMLDVDVKTWVTTRRFVLYTEDVAKVIATGEIIENGVPFFMPAGKDFTLDLGRNGKWLIHNSFMMENDCRT